MFDPTTANWQIFRKYKIQRNQFLKILNSSQAVILIAQGYFDKTIRGRTHHFSKEEAAVKISEIAYYYHTALILHTHVLKRLTTTGYDMSNNKKNRANTIFDIYQLFNVNDETMQGKKSVFVTNEAWLRAVAAESGFANRVIGLDTYLKLLGVDSRFVNS